MRDSIVPAISLLLLLNILEIYMDKFIHYNMKAAPLFITFYGEKNGQR